MTNSFDTVCRHTTSKQHWRQFLKFARDEQEQGLKLNSVFFPS
jgi:hypothetical protein